MNILTRESTFTSHFILLKMSAQANLVSSINYFKKEEQYNTQPDFSAALARYVIEDAQEKARLAADRLAALHYTTDLIEVRVDGTFAIVHDVHIVIKPFITGSKGHFVENISCPCTPHSKCMYRDDFNGAYTHITFEHAPECTLPFNTINEHVQGSFWLAKNENSSCVDSLSTKYLSVTMSDAVA